MQGENNNSSNDFTVNDDLDRERRRATFNSEKLTNFLDGGKERTSRRRHLESIIARDPTGIFSNEDNAYLHRTQRHVRALAKMVRLMEICRMIGIDMTAHDGNLIANDDYRYLIQAISDDPSPLSLHWVMFMPNIRSLCDDEQQRHWLPLCQQWKVIGCYAQTELGHGSNVRALETTATFRSERDGGLRGGGSWIIHSPTLTSYKFWPGTLGRTANHAMVIARLIDGENVDRGIHNFIVPLRCLESHKPLPGITVGDIGPKIGYNNMDNGYAKFDNFEIPRRNMAMRFATVDQNGHYSTKIMSDASSKVAYITMMQVRAFIISDTAKHLGVACTISIRYSAVRRQGYDQRRGGAKTGAEVQILDYVQQQHRILPLLACTYCFHFTGKKILAKLNDIERMLVRDQVVSKEQVSDLHASTSCLKAFCTNVAADGIEDCRKACGGHGFLQASGLPELLTTYLQNPTVEGDNYMLPQQTVRVLLKIVQALREDDHNALSSYSECDSVYLIGGMRDIMDGKFETFAPTSSEEVMDLSVLLHAFKHRASRLLLDTAQQIQKDLEYGIPMQDCWNETLVQVARVSKAHSLYLILKNCGDGIDDTRHAKSHDLIGPNESLILEDLALLFSLWWIEKDIGDFLEDGFMTRDQAAMIRQSVLLMLRKVRPNAVALVDAKDISDFRLKSVLGRHDGNVYPAILASARKDPLNATEPGPGFEHIRQLMMNDRGVKYTASRL